MCSLLKDGTSSKIGNKHARQRDVFYGGRLFARTYVAIENTTPINATFLKRFICFYYRTLREIGLSKWLLVVFEREGRKL